MGFFNTASSETEQLTTALVTARRELIEGGFESEEAFALVLAMVTTANKQS